MKNEIAKLVSLGGFLLLAATSMAQSEGSGNSWLTGTIIAVLIVLVISLIVTVGENLTAIQARQSGVDNADLSIVPRIRSLFAPKAPAYVPKEPMTVLKRGFTINLLGDPDKRIDEVRGKTFAIQPPNFRGIAPIPKLLVEEGAVIKAGDPVFFDKSNPDIRYVSPVSGEVIAVNRGEKRAITEVVVLADKEQQFRSYQVPDPEKSSREDMVKFLMDSGGWTLIHQRPFAIVPEADVIPRDIFISTFDTAPLSPDLSLLVEGREAAFQKGLDVLGKLTPGDVFLGMDGNGKSAPPAVFAEATGVKRHWFKGKHPAGNVGIQIHHIKPMSPRDKVWVLGVQEVITLGTLFLEGKWDASRVVAITGEELKHPRYIRTTAGVQVKDLLEDEIKTDKEVRIISGDVLNGQRKEMDQYLNFYDDQLTVVLEGDYYEMFGWLIPQKSRPSHSRTYPNFLFSNLEFRADTNRHGEKRAFVVTGQYEDVLPMDIYPQHLFKAILARDFEKMEGLGIHELVEEDIALCEFVCTSKQPLQDILREGLNMMHEQG